MTTTMDIQYLVNKEKGERRRKNIKYELLRKRGTKRLFNHTEDIISYDSLLTVRDALET